ncbi:WD40 repeat-like protein [Suillus weaverae]|nr:WD40 repeat-like protein [Suillus weaverae]
MGSISQDLFRESMILIPVKTSDRYPGITSIAYFPDGQRMISGSGDKTARRWDLQSGKEIEEAQDVCKEEIRAVAVSRDGRWVVTGGGDDYLAELKACKVESAVVKRFEGHSDMINCLDISADNALLASGSDDKTARIWNLDTGKLVAGPFQSEDWVGAVRFSQNSKKLAVKSPTGKYLEVWDIQSQKLDVRKGKCDRPGGFTYAPVFWTNKNKTIIAAFSFTDHEPTTIYEFDASTLKTIGTPFKGHTRIVKSLALLFDGAFLVSTSDDFTAKLWAFESRQLLGSYDCDNTIQTLVSSPNSLQVAFTAYADSDIYIWNATPALLAIPGVPRSDATLKHLLNSDATRRPAAVRKTPANLKRPVIFSPPRRHFLPHVRKLFHFTSRTNTVPPVQPRDPWDVCLFISYILELTPPFPTVPCYIAPASQPLSFGTCKSL